MNEEKNMPAFPCGVSQDHHNCGCEPAAWGLSKLEIFAMHAPEIPEWFVMSEGKVGDMGYYSLKERERLFFEWRRHYAEQMIDKLMDITPFGPD